MSGLTGEEPEVTLAIKAQNPDLETARQKIAWWEQTCDHDWEVEYLPDPHSTGGVVRSGDLRCPKCFATKEDR